MTVHSTTEHDFETLAAWIREKPGRLEQVRAFLDTATATDHTAIDIEDIQADVGPLVQLLDTLAFLLQGVPRNEVDKEQYQADGLAWCALRMAQKIDRDIETMARDAAQGRADTAKNREGRA